MQEKESRLPKSPDEKETPKNSRNLWQTLQLFGAYLVGAWTIVQFLDWLLNRYQISPYWTDISLWVFVGIIPSLLVFLVNQERIIQRGLLRHEKLIIPLNFVLLFILVIYSFGGKDLGSITKNINYTDEEGNESNQNIIKSEFRISLPIFPFEQVTGTDTTDWIGKSLALCLSADMSQDKYLNPLNLNDQEMVDKINAARLAGSKFFIDGGFRVSEVGYEIVPALRNTRNGKKLQERIFRGDNFLALVDSISIYLRQSIGLQSSQIDESIDLNVSDFITDNLEALKYFTEGVVNNNSRSFEKAIELDTTFAMAMTSYAIYLYINSRGKLEAEFLMDKAMRHRKKLPFSLQVLTMTFNYLIRNEFEKAEKLIKIQLELDPNNLQFNYLLAYMFYNNGEFEKFTAIIKRLFDRNPSPDLCIEVMNSVLLNGNAEQVEKDLPAILKEFPNQVGLLNLLVDVYMLQQKYDAAQETLEQMMVMNPDIEPFYSRMLDVIAYLKDHPLQRERLAQAQGVYRADMNERKINFDLINNAILRSNLSHSTFYYPVSDSSLVRSSSSFVNEYKLLSNDSTRFYGVLLQQIKSKGNAKKYYYWKQDSLIWQAEKFLKNRSYAEALPAYKAALAAHPEHYYLYTAKEHVEYMLSKPDTAIQQLYQRYVGDYDGDRRLWIEGGQLWYKRPSMSRRIFRPISDKEFIDLAEYNGIYCIDIKNDIVKGLFGFEYDKEFKEWYRVESYYVERKKFRD